MPKCIKLEILMKLVDIITIEPEYREIGKVDSHKSHSGTGREHCQES